MVTSTDTRPPALGYIAVPAHLHGDAADAALQAWTSELCVLAAREGYAFTGVFSDVRGRTEAGLYRMLQVLRTDTAVAVLAPDLDHLQHAGCLVGADQRTAARYLQARLLLATAAPAPLAAGRS